MFRHVKSGRVNFCPGELFLKLLARIGEWHQNLSEKTEYSIKNSDYNFKYNFIIWDEVDTNTKRDDYFQQMYYICLTSLTRVNSD